MFKSESDIHLYLGLGISVPSHYAYCPIVELKSQNETKLKMSCSSLSD
jgi:hypothetical protein